MRLGKFVDVFFSGFSGLLGETEDQGEQYGRVQMGFFDIFDSGDPLDERFRDGVYDALDSDFDDLAARPIRSRRSLKYPVGME